MDSKYELIKNSWRQEMRYKVGDKVRIKDDISACKYTNKQGLMDKWQGKVMTIRGYEDGFYKMKEDIYEYRDNDIPGWSWQDDMIEGLAEEPQDVYRSAINTYGQEKQVDIMIEEMSELTKALIKHRREPSDETLENIQEKIADVKIMMCQGAMMFGEEAVERFVHEKTERLRKRVEEKLEAANKKKKFRLEDYRGGYAMHCDTEKKAETFLKFLHRSGKNWRSGSSYLKSTHWGGFENEACYRFNEGTIGRLEFAKSEGYDILEFDDFYWGDVNE